MSKNPADTGISRHNSEIQENLRHWHRKPALRRAYARFYEMIAKELSDIPAGDVLECGSGIGNLKSVLPQTITSDLFNNPWLDRVENVYALSFPDRSLSAVVLFDVFHHLQYPGSGLIELNRVLRPSGKIIILEPAAGLLGRVALGLFHHEPLGLKERITWQAPAGTDFNSLGYYAAQGNAWRLFSGKNQPDLPASLSVKTVRHIPALPWLMTGGFRGPNLNPQWAGRLIEATEAVLNLAPRFFCSRMMITLEKS